MAFGYLTPNLHTIKRLMTESETYASGITDIVHNLLDEMCDDQVRNLKEILITLAEHGQELSRGE
jgi:hypothetical protein